MAKKPDLKSGLIHGKPAYIVAIFVMLGVLVLSILSAVTFGSVKLTVGQVYSEIAYKLFRVGDPEIYGSGVLHDIVWSIRLPRIIMAVGVGMSLALSGRILHAIVKNPLADPYILGISSGATLGATVAALLGVVSAFGTNAMGIFAFIGALIVSFLVQIIASIGNRSSSIRLLLAGTALSSVCSAISNFIVYIADDAEGMRSITFWLMGSLAGSKWEEITFCLPIMILISLFFISQSRVLNLMLLGDDVAVTLGTDLTRWRRLYMVLSAVLVGLAVYCTGMIGFVGLMIPHVVRILFGTDHKRLLPLSALTGAVFLIWADVACRIIIPKSEVPLGILVSAIGAPCFVYLLISKSYGFGEGKS
ncbi:MAG: iron ABC transporter permease [Clostridia bacterium]|nr:iron ABC transporter permease [Clostridia bacterium]